MTEQLRRRIKAVLDKPKTVVQAYGAVEGATLDYVNFSVTDAPVEGQLSLRREVKVPGHRVLIGFRHVEGIVHESWGLGIVKGRYQIFANERVFRRFAQNDIVAVGAHQGMAKPFIAVKVGQDVYFDHHVFVTNPHDGDSHLSVRPFLFDRFTGALIPARNPKTCWRAGHSPKGEASLEHLPGEVEDCAILMENVSRKLLDVGEFREEFPYQVALAALGVKTSDHDAWARSDENGATPRWVKPIRGMAACAEHVQGGAPILGRLDALRGVAAYADLIHKVKHAPGNVDVPTESRLSGNLAQMKWRALSKIN